ncbi:hypothetical protein TNCV_267141 [Trichonephila clavipes]|nr:hypothetical protein TNCV_267141 [Trichonephila clavipes]
MPRPKLTSHSLSLLIQSWGCGSPVVKVSDHGRHVMSSKSSTSLDYGSKLRASPRETEQCDVNIHSLIQSRSRR